MNTREELIARLSAVRQERCFSPTIRPLAKTIGERSLGILFPHFARFIDCEAEHIDAELNELVSLLDQFEQTLGELYPTVKTGVAQGLVNQLLPIYEGLREDANAIFHGDPAAKTIDEVILTYPGFQAIAVYRIAHQLLLLGVPLLPRLLAEWAHAETGIDIHPGAHIGRSFFIDHGTGVVIGETSVIGTGVKLYQGVTLGALVVEKELSGTKRHPTIENNVVIYANATILGGDTVIGHDSIVGGNAFITASIPAFSVVNRQSTVKVRASSEPDYLEFNI